MKTTAGAIEAKNGAIKLINDKWLDQIREDEKTATTSESIVRLNILIENREKGRAEESGIIWPTQEYFKSANNNFLKEAVKNIMKGSFYLFKRINIDPDLWRGVITAMLLRVPIEKVL